MAVKLIDSLLEMNATTISLHKCFNFSEVAN